MDVIIRVNVVRSFGVRNMIQLLRDSTLFNESQSSSVQEVLYAAAWVVGEFSGYMDHLAHIGIFLISAYRNEQIHTELR